VIAAVVVVVVHGRCWCCCIVVVVLLYCSIIVSIIVTMIDFVLVISRIDWFGSSGCPVCLFSSSGGYNGVYRFRINRALESLR
jgi:hypothetical protein